MTTLDRSWEKAPQQAGKHALTGSGGRWKFLVGGLLILGAVAYLVIGGTLTGARFFITVDDLVNDDSKIGETVRVTGAVLGESITTETVAHATHGETTRITFTVANVPAEYDNLAEALNVAVNDTQSARMEVVYHGTMPDLLQHEAQAIMTGELGPDGVFHATELLLKCPSRFEGEGSDQQLGEDHPGMARIDGNAG